MRHCFLMSLLLLWRLHWSIRNCFLKGDWIRGVQGKNSSSCSATWNKYLEYFWNSTNERYRRWLFVVIACGAFRIHMHSVYIRRRGLIIESCVCLWCRSKWRTKKCIEDCCGVLEQLLHESCIDLLLLVIWTFLLTQKSTKRVIKEGNATHNEESGTMGNCTLKTCGKVRGTQEEYVELMISLCWWMWLWVVGFFCCFLDFIAVIQCIESEVSFMGA